MSGMTPKPVLALGNGGSGNIAMLLDKFGVVQVSPPTQIPIVLGTGLTAAVESQATLVNALLAAFPDLTGTSLAIVPAPLTVSETYTQNYNTGVIDVLLDGDPTIDAYDPVGIGNTQGSLLTIAQNYAWNGATYDRIRVATVFKTALVTSTGTTAVWTPAAGKSFRLMGYSIDVAGTAAATGVQTIELLDAAVVIKNHLATVLQTFAPTTALQGVFISVDLGQGQLSAAANNVLNIHLSEAMASGGVAVNVWGTEE